MYLLKFYTRPLLSILLFILSLGDSRVEATKETCNSTPQPLYFRLGSCSVPVGSWYTSTVTSIDSWGLEAFIGNPFQAVCLEASTFINNVALMTVDICNNDNTSTYDQCVNRRGGLVDPTSGSNFTSTSTSSLTPDLDWNRLNPNYSAAARTTLEFSDISISSLVALVDSAPNSSVSQLGLGNNSVILHDLMNAGLSPANGFSFMPGSQSPTNPRDGHLIIGGYDRGSLTGPFTTFPINSTFTVGQSSRACPLHVTVVGLSLDLPGNKQFPLISKGSKMDTCIEPLDNLFRFPQDILFDFRTFTNWSRNVTVPDNIFVVEPGLYYDTPFEGNLTFTILGGLEGELEVTIPSSELAWQAQGLDSSGKKTLVDNVTVVNVFHDVAAEDTAVLGKVFLAELLLAVNYETQNFKIARAITDGSPPLDLVSFDSTSPKPCSSGSSDGIRKGLIALGVIVGFILVLLVLLCFYLVKIKKQPPGAKNSHAKNVSTTTLPSQPAEVETKEKSVVGTTTSNFSPLPDNSSARRPTVASIPSAADDPVSPIDGAPLHEMASSPSGRLELDSHKAHNT